MSQPSAAEVAFDAAARILRDTTARLGRSKSLANRRAYSVAHDAYDEALLAFVLQQEAERDQARVDLRERRLAFVAPRRALLARQFSLAL